ncbi:MAG: 5'/3'-nucleotidase SurE, partial [Chloroflexota bacterium]
MTYILLANDDGVEAPGILALARAMNELADTVQAIAPATNQSMSGHKINLFSDIRVEENRTLADGTPAVAVHGSPADCIALASHGLVKWPPRLVVSGINRGANMGQDVFYSGTVSAAIESVIQGIPAVAVSLDNQAADNVEDYEVAARLAARVVARLLEQDLPEFTVLNLNVPYGVDVKGIRLTRTGVRIYNDEIVRDGDIVQVVGDAPTGGGYSDERGARVIAWAKAFLDETFPLTGASHADVTAYEITVEGLR